MNSSGISNRALPAAAMAGAGLLMAHQVAGKAARDAVFLSNYDPSALPAMMAAAAITAACLGLASSRVLSRLTPGRVVPWAFALSALLQLAEWRLLFTHPHLAAVAVYLHLVAFSAVLLSGFWSLTNELLDAHTAKRRFGQIAGAGTLGGILGGLAAERVNAWFDTRSVLAWLAVLHLAASLTLALMRALAGSRLRKPATAPDLEAQGSARQAFAKAPYLFSLAALVLIGTTTAAAIDWVFKSQVAAHYGRGEPLMRFLTLFHTAVAVTTFLVQTLATRFCLERWGLGRTVSVLPASVALGGLGALFSPVFGVLTAVRGAESVLRGSLFRSGYELFYTPIPVKEKRAAKSIIDVGADRLGDALGAGITQSFLWLGAGTASNRIQQTVTALAGEAFVLALRLDPGYVQAFEQSLLDRAVELDPGEVHDTTTRAVVLSEVAAAPAASSAMERTTEQVRPARPLEPLLQQLADLRSGKPERVCAVLQSIDRLEPLLAAQVVTLLGWDETTVPARAVLARAAPRICGQLVDCLLDPEQDFAIRRRIPPVLVHAANQRAADGLMLGFEDSRFEVRFQCGRALAEMIAKQPELSIKREQVLNVVERELSVSRSIWNGRRLLDRRDTSERTQFLDEVLRERADAGLEHVFTLLGLILPGEPLKVAFRALHTDDRLLRGLALEYLEAALPEHISRKLTHIVEQGPRETVRRSTDEVVASLMQSNQSVVLRLREKLGASGSG